MGELLLKKEAFALNHVVVAAITEGLWQEVGVGRLVLVMVEYGRLAKQLDGSWEA